MKRKTLMTTISALTLGAVVVATAIPVLAHGPEGGMMERPQGGQQRSFGLLDTDSDGKITKEEFTAHVLERFTSTDTDGDGALTAEEMMAVRPGGFEGPRGGHMGDHHGEGYGERHGDGYGERYGHGEGYGERYGHEKGEYGREMGEHGGRFGYDMGDRMRGAATPEMRAERAARMIEALDQNDDGLLSAEELTTPPSGERFFARMDANGDGMVTLEEFQAAKDGFAQSRGMGPMTGNQTPAQK